MDSTEFLRVQNPDSRTAPARAVMLRRAAQRAADDDVALARAVRVVRVALERQRLSIAELTSREAS